MTGLVVLTVNRMYAAALAPALERRGFDILLRPERAPDVRYVEVIQCTDEGDSASWARLKKADDLNRIGYVALLDDPPIETCRRAFRLGAAVVTTDADPRLAAEAIAARHDGEVRLATGLLVALLGGPADQLSDQERNVLKLVNEGRTLAQVAESMHYSERHVRRLLNAVLDKAGTKSRDAAAGYFGEVD